MIEKRTVFVLGAGASKPYGYPTGIELRRRVIKNYKRLISMMHSRGDDWTAYLPDPKTVAQFVEKFNKSDTNSIDLFLSRHSSDDAMVKRGKMAICSVILHCERKSQFNDALYDTRHEDWYNYLFMRMTDSMRTDSDLAFSNNQVSFITFNYDRSLEFYLHQALTNSFGAEHREFLEDELKKIEIVHIHGCIAKLPWQEAINTRILKYPVSELRAIDLIETAKQIKVVGEIDEDESIIKTHELLKKAEQIFFLGFGFASENFEILDIPNSLSTDGRVYGTVLGFSEREIKSIRSQFGRIAQKPGRLVLEPEDSRGLLRKYL